MTSSCLGRRWSPRCVLLFCLFCALPVVASPPATQRATGTLAGGFRIEDYSLRELLGMPVEAASRYHQPLDRAPSLVSSISAAEIELFGYRTLEQVA